MGKIQYDGGLTCAMPVKDLEKAIKWYQDYLGFKLQYKLAEMGWCEMESPVQRVNVGLSAVEKHQTGGGATLTFGVKDIEAARKELESRGVKFDGPVQTIEGMVKLTTFFDPDGNTLMFYQSLGSM